MTALAVLHSNILIISNSFTAGVVRSWEGGGGVGVGVGEGVEFHHHGTCIGLLSLTLPETPRV